MLAFIGNSLMTLVSGDTWVLPFNDPDHPNNLWTAVISFTRNGVVLFTKAGVVDIGNFKFTITAAESAASITPGGALIYVVFTNIADTTLRESEYGGGITVLPNPTTSMPPSANQQALTAVLATITLVLSQPEGSATFNGQTYTLQNIDTLYKIRNNLITDVNNELRGLGLTKKGSSRNILTRFR